jgi:hypothetical protein
MMPGGRFVMGITWRSSREEGLERAKARGAATLLYFHSPT